MAKRWLGVLFGSALSVAGLVAACADPTPPDVATYGPPNGLSGKEGQLPGPPDEGDGGGGTGSSSGTSSGTGSSSGATAQYLCQQQTPGATLADPDGGCSVSFTTDLFPKMQAGGTWNCASPANGCHGNLQAPLLTTNTATAFYTTLANFALGDDKGVPYINPCSTDPTKSGFACNVASTGTCGILMPSGAAMAAADQTAVATWVACGAPLN
jgi:hypothetical protein